MIHIGDYTYEPKALDAISESTAYAEINTKTGLKVVVKV